MIALNIQFWDGDKAQAMALARLIADLELKPRADVIVLFTARFDCQHDRETMEYVAQKFRVFQYTTKRKATGWPNGPNQMMADSYAYCAELWIRNRLPDLRAVFFIEADCVPLSRDWLDQIIAEYNGCGKKVLGAWLKKGDAGCEHVNGNCLIAIDLFQKFPAIFHPREKGGWDATLAYGILPNAHPSRLIWSDYRLGTADNPWTGCDHLWAPKVYGARDNVLYGQPLTPVYYHGIKTFDGINCVRQRLLNEP